MKKNYFFLIFVIVFQQTMANNDSAFVKQDSVLFQKDVWVDIDSTEMLQETKVVSDLDLLKWSDSILLNKKQYLEEAKLISYIALKKDELPDLSDDVIALKLNKIPTTLNIRFTPEIGDMVRRYLHVDRSFIVRMLTKAEYYFPMFEQELDKREMPLELKYLAVIESHLNPQAKSPMGATGLWQFMYATAKYKGLQISTLEDQRRDPAISTQYATDYLLQLYTIYEDWLLAMSSYNAGAGNINKAIRACGGVKNYWVARRFMPRETQQYVPRIIAVLYAMYYAEDYLLYPRNPEYSFYDIEQVKVFDQLTLKYCAELIGIEEEALSALNPVLSKNLVPKREDGYVINIPKERLYQFEQNEGFFYDDPYLADNNKALEEKHVAQHNYAGSGKYSNYTIETGDNLGYIAEKFNCSVADLKRWNALSSNFLSVGKKLKIYSNKSIVTNTSKPKESNEEVNIGFKKIEIDENTCSCHKHEIVYGDNLWDISVKYNSSIEKIKALNNIPQNWRLKLGIYLKIPKY